ncbi:MAG: hypothetical protein ACXW1W_14940 [Methylococcaceae bacterium]
MDITAQNQELKVDQLKKSAELVHAFYDETTDPKRKNLPMTTFRALATLTLERAETGVALEDIRFSPKELSEKISEIGFLSKTKQKDSEWVRGLWHNLEVEIEQRKSHLQDLSKRKGKDFYPWIGKEESNGGQGRFSYYYLIAKPFNQQDIAETIQYPCPEGGLHYVQESLSNAPKLAQWINGFTLQSWRKYAYILPGIVILLATLAYICLVLFLGMYTEISTVKWLTCLIAAFGLGGLVLSSPLYRVTSNRIVMASDWMMPIKETNVQLEFKKTGIDPETDNAIRELRLMVYSAKCSVCDGRVEVQSGGLQFPFRLVGRCIESPREHVFSFDHITRIGKPLM